VKFHRPVRTFCKISVAKILTIGSIIMMMVTRMVMVPPLLFLIDSGVACLHFAAHKHAAVSY
jgi:hypothetical protein